MMDPKLLLLAVYLNRIQPVRFLFQINLVRYFQCVVKTQRLFVSLWPEAGVCDRLLLKPIKLRGYVFRKQIYINEHRVIWSS